MANKKKKPVDEAASETPTEDASGGEAQAAATTEVKTHAQVVEDAKAAEAANAPEKTEADLANEAEVARTEGSEDLEAAKVDDSHKPDAESELAAPPEGEGPGVPVGGEKVPYVDELDAAEAEVRRLRVLVGEQLGVSVPEDADDAPEEKAAEDPAMSLEQLQKREACLMVISEIRETTSRNHMRPQDWWTERLSKLHIYIINT